MPAPEAMQPKGYRTQSPDTDEAAERYLFQRLRALPPWRKAEMLSASTRAACDLAMAGVRQRHPAAPAAELRKRFAALVLGREATSTSSTNRCAVPCATSRAST